MTTVIVRVEVNVVPILIIHGSLPIIGLLDTVISAKFEGPNSVIDSLLVIRLLISKEVLAIKAESRRVVVQTSGIVEGDEVNVGLEPDVGIKVRIVRRIVNIAVIGEGSIIHEVDDIVVEEVDRITNLTIVRVLGLDSHKRVRVVVSNLATVEPIEITIAWQNTIINFE